MSGTDELKNKAQELGGRGKEAAGDEAPESEVTVR